MYETSDFGINTTKCHWIFPFITLLCCSKKCPVIPQGDMFIREFQCKDVNGMSTV